MTIQSNLKVRLAEENLKRARVGQSPISVRELSRATGITHSALVKLLNGQSTMVSFETIDKLMEFFNTDNINEILVRVPSIND
jgi:DNA-binding Xre family transcriptional regulator